MPYVVPMFESERGWGSKVDGYAGPFSTEDAALAFRRAYNLKHNNEPVVPDWYISALTPEPYTSQNCDYKTTIDGVDYESA